MPNAAYFTAMAARCCGLLEIATDRQIIEQLRLWIADFETEATRTRDQLRRLRTINQDRP